MVVKNTQAVAKATAPRLPPLHKLRVRKPDQAGANPCIGVMSSVLGMLDRNPLRPAALALTRFSGCWASSGYTAQGCAALEQQLRACMDAPVCFGRLILTYAHSNSSRRAESWSNQEEFHQLSSLEIISPDHRPPQAKLDVCQISLPFTTAFWHYTAYRRQEYSLLILASLSQAASFPSLCTTTLSFDMYNSSQKGPVSQDHFLISYCLFDHDPCASGYALSKKLSDYSPAPCTHA